MHVTVFGATGGTGQQLTHQALAAGHQVTAVVRSPDRLPLRHEQLTVVTAQVTEDEPELLRSALQGSDAVFSALGPPGRQPSQVTSAGMAHILRAMREADVRRLLAVSAAPLGPPAEGDSLFARRLVLPLLRRVLRNVYADLAVMEREIRASGTDWTVVRPPKLLNRPLTGTYRTAVGANPPGGQQIARADLAHAMLAMTGDETVFNRTVGVAY